MEMGRQKAVKSPTVAPRAAVCRCLGGRLRLGPGGAGGRKLDLGLIMEQVKVLITVANTQELLRRITDKCFHKCIGKPGAAGQLGAEVPRHVPRGYSGSAPTCDPGELGGLPACLERWKGPIKDQRRKKKVLRYPGGAGLWGAQEELSEDTAGRR